LTVKYMSSLSKTNDPQPGAGRKVVDHIIMQLLDLQNGKLWMGDNFAVKINAITEDEAFVKPLPTMHSVAELIAHLTAWNNDAILKINTGTGRLRDNDADNWPDNGSLKEVGLKGLLNRYSDSVNQIVLLLKTKDDLFLKERYFDQDFDGEFDMAFLIEGIVHHCIYHLGQIGIVIKLIKGK
jgi:hypothetical protein